MRAAWMVLALGVGACGGSVDDTESVNGQGGSAGGGSGATGGTGSGGSGATGAGGSGAGTGGSGASTGGVGGALVDRCLAQPEACCQDICAAVRTRCNVTSTDCECNGPPPVSAECDQAFAEAMACVVSQGEAVFGCDASGSGVLLCGPCDDPLAEVARTCGQEIQCTFR